LSKLIASFEELYVWLQVQSISLIWKQKGGAGFQDWHIDLANNGQTVYTICVNIGSKDIPVDGEINYPNANTDAYAPGICVDEGEAKNRTLVTVNARMRKHLLVTKMVLQSLYLLHAVWNILTTTLILTQLEVILMRSYGRPFQEAVIQGITFWVDL
jgi:hypothetical protein